MMEENSKFRRLECHFNWDLDKPSKETLDERIRANDNHIKYNAKDTLPESYCHQAYLESLKDNPDYDKMLESINKADDIVKEHIKSSGNKDFNNLPIGSGMKAVVLANKVFCLSNRQDVDGDIDAESCYDEYNQLQEKSLSNLAEHPEVLISKAFSLRGSVNIDKVSEAVKIFQEALSNIDYWENENRNRMDSVLYSLVLSKFKASQDRTLSSKEWEDIELFLRRAIQINPENHQAILKLAEVLAKTLDDFLLDEVVYFIEKAEELNNDGRNIIILEGIATVYETMKYGDQIENKEKAIEYYDRAKVINPESRRSLYGLSMCHHQIFKLKSKEYVLKKNDNINENKGHLTKAKASLETHKNNVKTLKHGENLELASIYMTLAKLENKNKATKISNETKPNETKLKEPNYLEEAEKLYKEIISKSKNEGDKCRLLEAYAGYADLFEYKEDNTKKIQYLKKVVKIASNPKYDSMQVQKCVIDSHKKLLLYADDQKEYEQFQLKGWIQYCRGKVHNAIYYYKQALKKHEEENMQKGITEELIGLLLKASDQDYQLYHGNIGKQLLDEALEKIAKVSDKVSKSDLMYRAMCIKVKKMNDTDEIKRLIAFRMDFEEQSLEYIINLSSNKVIDKKMDETLLQTVLDVVSESKRLLDQGMDMIKKKLYNGNLPFCYYPGPQKLDSAASEKLKKEENKVEREKTNKTKASSSAKNDTVATEEKVIPIEEKMKYLLEERYKWKDFSNKLPKLFQYLVHKQPEKSTETYTWLQRFINVRDEREHNHEYMEIMRESFTTSHSRIDLARNCSDYAIEVWKTIKKQVDRFEAMEKCKKELEEL